MNMAESMVLLHSIRHWMAYVFNADIDLVAPSFCMINEYIAFVSGRMSIFLRILIAFDRLVTVFYPNRLLVLKKRWFQCVLVIGALVYSLFMHISLPLNYRLILVNNTNSSQSSLVCYLPPNISSQHGWIFLANVFFFITIVNSTLSCIMVWKLISSRQNIASNSSSQQRNRDRKFILSSLVLNITCVLFKMPFACFLFASSYLTLSLDLFRLFFLNHASP